MDRRGWSKIKQSPFKTQERLFGFDPVATGISHQTPIGRDNPVTRD
jgi:hypothetical protein